MLKTKTESLYFSSSQRQARNKFCRALQKKLDKIELRRPLIFLCIGSDRVTGDSLGPLVGQQLAANRSFPKKAVVYGTLHQTVHAGNLEKTLTDIYNHYNNPYIIAIDASLGVEEHIGFVTLGDGSLQPGVGVGRNLPETGNIHITGIVNHATDNNQLTLQTTRLFTVMKLASFISDGILTALHVRSSL